MPVGIRFSLSTVGADDHIGPQARKPRPLRCHSEEQSDEESPSSVAIFWGIFRLRYAQDDIGDGLPRTCGARNDNDEGS